MSLHLNQIQSLQETKAKYLRLLESLDPEQVEALPPLIVRRHRSYQVRDQTFTLLRPDSANNKNMEEDEDDEDTIDDEDVSGYVALAEPITSGIVSVSATIHALKGDPAITLSLVPAAGPLSPLRTLKDVNLKISFESTDGDIVVEATSIGYTVSGSRCHDPLEEGDTVVMEVNMESNPRTVQFFVNGKAGKSYVSGIPQSIRLMMMTEGVGTSFRLNSVTQLATPTPFPQGERVMKRFSEQLTIVEIQAPLPDDENVTGFVAIAEPITTGIVSVSVTINDLAEIEDPPAFCLCLTHLPDPLSPLRAISDCDMKVYLEPIEGSLRIWSTLTKFAVSATRCHKPLKEGDTVVMEVDMESNPRTVQYFVNGKAGESYVANIPEAMRTDKW
ncbi:hypothetical protein BLNAU_17460 [Blattamonas nauphoetae]|uniref:SPRY domain-containing protein n=1 Tax=Blattamonas nauphoetae TaxID=2049346 RepID=A0ABQ9X8Q6_9EUKA|nr:hypothetical protein BLNAU_17460 [Blattamonas nauphoetae]